MIQFFATGKLKDTKRRGEARPGVAMSQPGKAMTATSHFNCELKIAVI
jgi:hypothetical protein